MAGVGAADVELVDGDAGGVVERVDDFEAVLDGVAEDVGDDGRAAEFLQLWGVFLR